MAKNTGVYKNKNGNMSVIEFLNLIDKDELDNYKRYKKLSLHKCPPKELIDIKQTCFYCIDCVNSCMDRVKIQKTGYKVGRKRYKYKDMPELTKGLEIPNFKGDSEKLRTEVSERGW